MPTAHQTLIDQRASAWTAATSILDTAAEEQRELTAEERSAYDAADAEVDRLTADIERYERSAQRGDLSAPPALPGAPAEHRDATPDIDAEYREAFASWVVNGQLDMTADQRSALKKGHAEMSTAELRAAGVGTNSAGGYLIPQGFRNKLVEKMKAYGAVQDVAEVITTSTGNVLPWPTNDDTSNVGALLAENTQISEQDLTFGTAQLDAYTYTSKLVRVSWQLLQDLEWLGVEDLLARKFGERLGRITNQHLTTGTGSSQPNGIVTGSTSGVTAASATTFTADELIDLQHSVDPAYRNENSKFMFADAALKILRKLKDSDGQYLWQPALIAGTPSTVLGSAYVVNQDMPALTTGNKPVLYGDFAAGYVVRIVRDFQMVQLRERYADYLQTGFFAFERLDGEVQDASAYKALTLA